MKKVYRVYNKVFNIYFSMKNKVEKFLEKNNTSATRQLEVEAINVF